MTANRYAQTRIPQARALGAPSVMAGTYTGAELQPFAARPAAMAAFELPSRVGGRRYFRGGAIELVAAGADVAGGAA